MAKLYSRKQNLGTNPQGARGDTASKMLNAPLRGVTERVGVSGAGLLNRMEYTWHEYNWEQVRVGRAPAELWSRICTRKKKLTKHWKLTSINKSQSFTTG